MLHGKASSSLMSLVVVLTCTMSNGFSRQVSKPGSDPSPSVNEFCVSASTMLTVKRYWMQTLFSSFLCLIVVTCTYVILLNSLVLL